MSAGIPRLVSVTSQTIYSAQRTRNSSLQAGVRWASSASSSSRFVVQTPPPSPAPTPSSSSPRNKQRGSQMKKKPQTQLSQEQVQLIADFTSALEGEALQSAWQAWTQILEKVPGHQGVALQEDRLRELLQNSKAADERLGKMALHFARKHRWASLMKCLLGLVQRQQYEAALEASNTFFQWLREDQGSMMMDSTQANKMRSSICSMIVLVSVACAKMENPSILPLINAVRPLTPYKIDKAGARNRTNPESASNGSPISLSRATKEVESLQLDPEASQLSLSYCRQVMLAWGLDYTSPLDREDGNFLARRFDLLFQAQMFVQIDMLIATAQEVLASKDRWLTITASQHPSAEWNDSTWHVLLSGSISHRRKPWAAQIWAAYNSIKSASESPSNKIWNALLDGYGSIQEWKSVQETWKQMQASGRTPDVFSYTSLMTAMFRARMSDDAMLLLEEMKDKAAKGTLPFTPEAVSAVVKGLLINGRSREAHELFQQVRAGTLNGFPKPNNSVVNVFLHEYARQGDLAKLIELLKSFSEMGLEPDVVTYTTVLQAYIDAGIEGGTEKVLALMQRSGVPANSVTLTLIIRDLVSGAERDSDDIHFNQAFIILRQMESEGPHPTAVTYTVLIGALSNHPTPFRRLLESGTLHPYYLERLKKDTQTGLSTEEEVALLRHRPNLKLATHLFRISLARGIMPARVCCKTLIYGLLADRYAGSYGDTGGVMADKACIKIAMLVFDELQQYMPTYVDGWVLVLQRLKLLCGDPALRSTAQQYLLACLDRIKELPTEMQETKALQDEIALAIEAVA